MHTTNDKIFVDFDTSSRQTITLRKDLFQSINKVLSLEHTKNLNFEIAYKINCPKIKIRSLVKSY